MIRLFTITTLFLAFGCPIEATKRLDTFLPSSLKQNPYYQKGYQTARAMIASPQNILAHEKQMQNDIDELKPHLEMAETSEEFKRAFQKIKAYASGVMDFTKEFNWELHLEKRNIVLTADNKAFASKLIAMSNALFTSIIEAENKADFKEKFEHLLLHTWSPFLREITKPSKKARAGFIVDKKDEKNAYYTRGRNIGKQIISNFTTKNLSKAQSDRNYRGIIDQELKVFTNITHTHDATSRLYKETMRNFKLLCAGIKKEIAAASPSNILKRMRLQKETPEGNQKAEQVLRGILEKLQLLTIEILDTALIENDMDNFGLSTFRIILVEVRDFLSSAQRNLGKSLS